MNLEFGDRRKARSTELIKLRPGQLYGSGVDEECSVRRMANDLHEEVSKAWRRLDEKIRLVVL